LVDTLERLERKLAAGAQCVQTNIVYDVRTLRRVAGTDRRRRRHRARADDRRRDTTAQHAHAEAHARRIPGVEVDDATFERMSGLEGDAAKAAGIEIAVEIIERLRELPDVAGVHIMARAGRRRPSRWWSRARVWRARRRAESAAPRRAGERCRGRRSGLVDEADERPALARREAGEHTAAGLADRRRGGHVLRAGVHVAEEPLDDARAQGVVPAAV